MAYTGLSFATAISLTYYLISTDPVATVKHNYVFRNTGFDRIIDKGPQQFINVSHTDCLLLDPCEDRLKKLGL
jgi:hypothetical protein